MPKTKGNQNKIYQY